jgi:nitrogen fixation/metabolism regulation signal transduction histidine kinase
MSGATSSVPAAAGGRHQRRLRNYLLDRHFQLKYSAYLMGTALVLSVALGLVLWRTSDAVIAQSREAVSQGEQVVAVGRDVVEESKKVSAVVQMNIVRDPVYSDNPALLEAFKADAEQQDARLLQQQRALEAQSQALKQQSSALMVKQRSMLITLCLALFVLVIAIFLVGIVVTHKIAGPVHKMKRHLREVSDGQLKVPGGLRKGDELVDFFETFNTMVKSLRARQEREIALLDSAISRLENQSQPSDLQPLRELKHDMERALDV